MAQFVQHDTDKQQQNEQSALYSHRSATLQIVSGRDPGQENQEGDVDLQIDSADAANSNGPFHLCTPLSVVFWNFNVHAGLALSYLRLGLRPFVQAPPAAVPNAALHHNAPH